jgi:DNA-directed RNA polymerase I and III subunit RPAC2
VVCRELLEKMELGSNLDNSKSTFTLVDEDHTLANALRFTLNQESVLSESLILP